MHKQLPPASKIAGGKVVPACVGLCTLPIAMASSASCLLPPLTASLWAHGVLTPLTFLWAVQAATSCCLGCSFVPRNCPAVLCTGLMCKCWSGTCLLYTQGPSALRVILICDSYSTCLAHMDCLQGSALEAATCCCFLQIPT